jgi:hypothetical protein
MFGRKNSQAENGDELTPDEGRAIQGLRAVAAAWPQTLALFMRDDGSMAVVGAGDPNVIDSPPEYRHRAFLATDVFIQHYRESDL